MGIESVRKTYTTRRSFDMAGSGEHADDYFAMPAPLEQQPREKSGGCLQCRNCGRTFTQPYNMVRHRRKCEGKFHLQCPYCGRGFYRRDKFNIHLLKHMHPPAH
ncbi:hypothetical protein ACOMHN_055146 [Nucella lapillus]